MDTHQAFQVFHNVFLVDRNGKHPEPFTTITVDDLEKGIWRFNPLVAPSLKFTEAEGQRYVEHYARELEASGKYALTIWPYHAMLGGIGHALVSAVEEAVFFHGISRGSQPDFQVKGRNPLTENYSVLRPEVTTGPEGERIGAKNLKFIQKLLNFDAVIIAGQAKSHCVAWTIEDLLDEINTTGQPLAEKVYLLEDCTSPVVIPGVVDYTETADQAFRKFADAGMHLVQSTTPMHAWPNFGG
jgi:nicotinamidase-related amidase